MLMAPLIFVFPSSISLLRQHEPAPTGQWKPPLESATVVVGQLPSVASSFGPFYLNYS
jgi:hypothetical protein